jgi:arylsulfatase
VGLFGWSIGPGLEAVMKYKETLKKYPNPPAANLTKF